MPIEFRCDKCGKLLRVAEETAGKQAKCPSCGAVVAIPLSSQIPSQTPPIGSSSSSSNPFATGATPPPPGSSAEANPFQSTAAASNPFATPESGPQPYQPTGADFNPYQAPSSGSVGFDPAATSFQRTFEPTAVELGDVFSRTWFIYKQHLGLLVVAILIIGACSIAFNVVVGLPLNLMIEAMQNQAGGLGPEFFLVYFGTQAITHAFSAWLWFGITNFMLNVARGGTPEVTDLFKVGRFYLPGLVIYILLLLSTALGCLLLIIPGILVFVFFIYSFCVLIDRRAGIVESMQLASQLASVNFANVFVILLAMFGLYIVGVCPGFCIGGLFSWSYAMLLFAVGYLMMSGQVTAAPWTPTYPQGSPQVS